MPTVPAWGASPHVKSHPISSGPGHHHRDDKLNSQGKHLGWGPLLQLQQPPSRGRTHGRGQPTPPEGGPKQKMDRLMQRGTLKTARQIYSMTWPHRQTPSPVSCYGCSKNQPLPQLCNTWPQILHHKPGSCYYLRQAPASWPSLLYFAEDFAQGAGFLLLFTTSTRLLVQL